MKQKRELEVTIEKISLCPGRNASLKQKIVSGVGGIINNTMNVVLMLLIFLVEKLVKNKRDIQLEKLLFLATSLVTRNQ